MIGILWAYAITIAWLVPPIRLVRPAPGLVDASILCPADQKLTGHLAVRTKNLISISIQKIFTADEGW